MREATEARLAEEALRRAEQLAAAGKIAASISHEINNPLEAVTNLLFLAKGDPYLSHETRQHLEIADKELARLSHIARTSLKFYRQTSAPLDVSVQDVLDSVLMVFQARITNFNINLIKHYREVPLLCCFAGEVQQVFTNLISNALDACRRGGTLTVSVRESGGGPEWSQRGIRVTIVDTGTGMDRDTRARLFEPFFTTKSESGTGLGLWVTKGIIDKHQGTITIASTPGKGTAFSVFFPSDGIGKSAAA